MKEQNRIYGLIGHPLGHSFSQKFFNDKFKTENIDAEYLNFDISDVSELKNIVDSTPNIRGLNVTIPYKERVMTLLDEVDDAAKQIGAVNVIQVKHLSDKIVLKGYNSDFIGFKDSIEPLLSRTHKKALVLGTGGAAKAVVYALKLLGIGVQSVSREKKTGAITYDELDDEVMKSHQIVVNTTPLGMYPDIAHCADIPYSLLSGTHLCYDLVYNPEETLFLKKAKLQGAVVKNGFDMLLCQALAAWKIWQMQE